MAIILGVDVGGSTTKIVAFDKEIIGTLQVRANDQMTSLFGAIGNLLYQHRLKLEEIEKIILTGVGATLIKKDIYGIPTFQVNEFEAIGYGGLMLSGLSEALVVSMGTGTAFVQASKDQITHIGGSGVGGGTLLGLSSKLLGESDIEAVIACAQAGDLSHVDLSISEISNTKIPTLPATATASNFGKIKSTATGGDLALGLINMVFQTAGVLSAFCCTGRGIRDIVVTGSMATLPQAQEMLDAVGSLYGLHFLIPEDAIFATAIGAATLHHYREQNAKNQK